MVHRRVDLQGGGAFAPLVIGHTVNGGIGPGGPAGTRRDAVACVAVDPQNIGIGQGRNIRALQQQRIVTGAGQVDDFNAAHLEVGNGRHIDRDAGAFDQQGIGAGVAVGAKTASCVENQGVIAKTASHEIDAAATV